MTSSTGRMSRRGFLGMGAALGASVVVPGWSWAGSPSMAGLGGSTPPWLVWDDEADPVIAAVIERGEVPAVNAAAARVDEERPGRCRPGCRATCARSSRTLAACPRGRTPPSSRRPSTFNKRRGTYLGVAYAFTSGMMSTVIPHEARAVYYSRGGADMKRRISRTAKFGYDIGSLGGFHDPNGEMIVTAVKTRMAHAGVRHLLPQSPHWNGQGGRGHPDQPARHPRHLAQPADVGEAVDGEVGRQEPAAELEAFLHSWQVAAHMLGVRDEYIPATWARPYAQAPEILDPVLAPTPEGIKLADILLDLASDADGGVVTRSLLESLTRYNLGDQIAEWLQIPRHPGQDETLAAAWPQFVRLKEAGLYVPGSSELYWAFDEILRRGALWYLGEGEPIYIEIPDTNNPNYS